MANSIDPITQAYLDGLYAAALICQDKAGDKHSTYSDAIMKFRATHEMKAVRKAAKEQLVYEAFQKGRIGEKKDFLTGDVLKRYSGDFTD